MKKLLHERLRETDQDRFFFNCNTKDLASVIGEETDCLVQCSECRNRIYSALADEIERYYIPRPRFEDGEPVQFGDKYICNNGTIQIVKTIGKGLSGKLYINPDSIEGYRVYFHENEYAKRPQPKVLDADGVEINVGDTVWSIGGAKYIVFEIENENRIHLRRPYEITPLVKMTNRCITHKEPDSLDKLCDDIAEVGLSNFADRLSALIDRGAQ